jgi:hypothetical protein
MNTISERCRRDIIQESFSMYFQYELYFAELEIDSIDAIIGHQFVTNVNNFLQFQMLNDVLESSL